MEGFKRYIKARDEGGERMKYNLKDLEYWSDKIEYIAKDLGLNYYDQEFEIINYNEMLCYEAYLGMPSRYPHWSFGKNYDKLRTLYQHNIMGLPYEIVINSNPCIAYLMKDNPLPLQILTMAHVYGHNDFFKNNRMFKENTEGEKVLDNFKNNSKLIRKYADDFNIGRKKVERVLDIAHSIKFQEELITYIMNSKRLEKWQRDILRIVKEESIYFISQIETKIINEGWASFWHYEILKLLDLPQDYFIDIIRIHNSVVAPIVGKLNPYNIGFNLFKSIEKKYGRYKIFEAREIERDESFIRKYLDEELCIDLNLYKYGFYDGENIVEGTLKDIGFEGMKDTLYLNCGINTIPNIIIKDDNNNLILKQQCDIRELNIEYAKETLKNIVEILNKKVILETTENGENILIMCNLNKEIVYK
ncbi:stage V sporulation protein R [Clostridium tetani E88]|uniref:Stage V sporulation protein R n=2 Tax=Clostridium tetani TaxID=1513 RepID=Q896G5_CLOTE|nr:stage V sporulation protein R [Clostridium tetani E88]